MATKFLNTDYILCSGRTEAGAPCPFFVDVNYDHEDAPDNIAPWIHLTRGDDADNAQDDHEPMPGEVHTLAWWMENGPERVRERFVVEPGAFGIEYDPDGDIKCGECEMRWSQDITPAGRCPWEYDH